MRQYDYCMRRRNLRSVLADELADSAIRPQDLRRQGTSLLFNPGQYFTAFLIQLGVTDLADLSISDFNRILGRAEAEQSADIADWEVQLGRDA